MGDISNFARQDTVSVVEFADYLREHLPPVQWHEAEAERDTWRQRAALQSGGKAVLPAARFCRTPVPAHFRRVLRRMPPAAI